MRFPLAQLACAFTRLLGVQGKASKDIEQLLGYVGPDEVIHRDNIGLTTLMERNRPANRSGGALGGVGGGGSGSSGHHSPNRGTSGDDLANLNRSPSLLLKAAAQRLYAEQRGTVPAHHLSSWAYLHTNALRDHCKPMLTLHREREPSLRLFPCCHRLVVPMSHHVTKSVALAALCCRRRVSVGGK